jgi:hypothetical protein
MRVLTTATLLSLALAATATTAQANMVCGKRQVFVDAMAKKYNEFPQGIGIAGQSDLLEIYVSEKGTWTIMVTKAQSGSSCILATGQSWETIPMPPKKLTGL